LVLPVIVCLAFLGGCAGATRVVHLTALDADLPSFSPAIRDYPEALAAAASVIRDDFGLEARPVALFLYPNRREFEKGLIEAGGYSPAVAQAAVQYARAVGTLGKILVNEDGLAQAPWADRLSLLAHELTHVAQFSLSGGVHGNSEQWLREGYADWVSYQVVERLGLNSYRRLRNDLAARLVAAARRGALPPLTDLSLFTDWNEIRDRRGGTVTYGVAFFAVEYLLQGRGPDAMAKYFRLFSSSPHRLINFRMAFGIDLDEFAKEFAQHFEKTVLR